MKNSDQTSGSYLVRNAIPKRINLIRLKIWVFLRFEIVKSIGRRGGGGLEVPIDKKYWAATSEFDVCEIFFVTFGLVSRLLKWKMKTTRRNIILWIYIDIIIIGKFRYTDNLELFVSFVFSLR